MAERQIDGRELVSKEEEKIIAKVNEVLLAMTLTNRMNNHQDQHFA